MKRVLTILLLLCAVAVAACGQSAQDKAKAQVCDARQDISKQIAALQSLTLSTGSIDQLKTALTSIGSDLTKIKDAQGPLTDARKQQLETATQTFTSQVTSIATSLLSSSSISGAEAQLKSAVTQLGDAYQQVLEPVNCS